MEDRNGTLQQAQTAMPRRAKIPYILALRGLGGAVAALLDLVKDIQRDQRFMLGFEPVKILDL